MLTGPNGERPLTRKREAFIREYVKDWNASAAARRAGYAPARSDVEGSRLLADARVKRRIEAIVAERARESTVSLEEAIRLLSADMREAKTVADRARAGHLLGRWMGWEKTAETKTTVEIDGFMVGAKVEDANG